MAKEIKSNIKALKSSKNGVGRYLRRSKVTLGPKAAHDHMKRDSFARSAHTKDGVPCS